MLKLLSEAFQNLTKVFKKTNNPAVKDELIKIGDELEALSEKVQKGSGKIEEQTVQLNKILDDINERDADFTKQRAIDTIASGDDPAARGFATPVDKGGADEAIQFVAEKTNLSFEEARLAIMEKINEGYPVGDFKRTAPNDTAQIKAYLDNNLNYGDAVTFLEDIEDIAFSGAIDLSSDSAKNVSRQAAKGVSDDLQKSLDLTDSYGFQVTKDLDDVVPFNELSPKDIEMIKLGVPMNSKKYRIETEAIRKGEMAPSQMSGIPESQAKALKSLEDEMLGGLDMKTFTKVSNAEIAEKERIIAVANDLIEEGRMTEARELLESIGEDLSADRVLNADGGRIGFEDGGQSNYYIGGKPATEEEYNMQGDYMDLTPEGMELFKAFRLENPDVDENIILDALKKQGYSGDMQGFARGGGVGSLFRMR